MSKFLKHFTVVGDDYHTWNVNYKKWENEEEEEEPAPTSAEGEGSAVGPDAEAGSASTPRPSLDFRSRLRKLFSSHRFQVREGGRQVSEVGAPFPAAAPASHKCFLSTLDALCSVV